MAFVVIVVIAVIVFLVLSVGGNVAGAKARTDLKNDPTARKMLFEPIEKWGKYDGSLESRARADKAMALLEDKLGRANSVTRDTYAKTLKQANIEIPLAAAYSFTVGNYLHDELAYDMLAAQSTSNPEIRQKESAMALLFPTLYRYIQSKHSGREATMIVCITSNLLDYFICEQ